MQALEAGQLHQYLKAHNSEHRTRLHIWKRTQDEAKSDRPNLLRFMIPDVMIIYISIGYQSHSGTILIENMSALAPRERVSPHFFGNEERKTDSSGSQKAPYLHSEYTVFRVLSQQLARVLHAQPQIGLQGVMVGQVSSFIEKRVEA